MSAEKGGPDESRKDATNEARRTVGPQATFHRISAGISTAIASMRREVTGTSLAAKVKARVPPQWRRPRRLALVGGGVAVLIVLIIANLPSGTTRHPAPGTTVFPISNQVVVRFVHSAGSVHVVAGSAGQVSITEHRHGITSAIHTTYRQQADGISVAVSVGAGLYPGTWVHFTVAIPRAASANV